MARLTDKQQRFIDEYFLCGLNATEAAERAGYRAKSRAVFASIGAENLRKPHIRAEIDRRLEESAMSADEVLYRLSQQARATVADYFDVSSQGTPRLNLARAVVNGTMDNLKSIKITHNEQGTNIEIQLHDAQSALTQLGRYHKLFTDKVQISDWRDDAIQAIRAGEIEFNPLAAEVGESLAAQLFRQAGVTRLVDAGETGVGETDN